MTGPSPDPLPLVLLHALGQAPMAWEDVVVRLYGSRRLLTPWVPGLRPTERKTVPMAEAAAALDQDLMLEGMRQVDLCGVSYGAMVAAQVAADYPERVRRLVLVGGQVRPSRTVLRLQSALVRMVPRSRLADAGVSKEQVLRSQQVVRALDLTEALPRITARTLVVVGGKDLANQAGARALAAGIPDARLRVLEGAGHLVNTEKPEELTELLRDFLDG
ncbi:alpha/beta fold hydrolase [Ornithinimicrobium avium]|uniref:Alpha/beta fold hydrolase n=1 Tax=Ornithinimicrobium avium TaxID=2283195 RepID=A0A345NPT4_9MICO|nr:alpha/beta hydrolase [Ornithinimicrobium avium]AXH97042.1 alpha/beta fold hydrolase [Ornithinimicrobium avium]